MKTLIAALTIFMATTAFAPPQALQYVYISDNPKDTLYHKDKDCKECNNKGKDKVMKVTLDDAIHKYKRKPCPVCYKS